MNKIIIIRGLPGSGKTTKAKELSFKLNVPYVENDMFFTDQDGKYLWDKNKVYTAALYCNLLCRAYLLKHHLVIVSNTFTTYKEFRSYLDIAQEYNAEIEVINCLFSKDPESSYKNNIHRVPFETIVNMYERNLNVPDGVYHYVQLKKLLQGIIND
jgi:tRNA uridine 5-carbamoylmethylation protein Kti12